VEDLGVELKKADSEVTGKPGGGIKTTTEAEGNGEARGFVRRMLFPEKDDGVWQTTLSRGNFKRRWFDGELNYEQQVRMAFDGLAHAPLFSYCIIRWRMFVLLVDELHYGLVFAVEGAYRRQCGLRSKGQVERQKSG
jgi:hypothetical protein